MDETVISYWYGVGFRRGLVISLLCLILARIVTYYLLQEVFRNAVSPGFQSQPRAADPPPPKPAPSDPDK